MISINRLFLNEAVIGKFSTSVSNIVKNKKPVQTVPAREDSIVKIEKGHESIKRLIPRPTSDDQYLGFKPIHLRRIPAK